MSQYNLNNQFFQSGGRKSQQRPQSAAAQSMRSTRSNNLLMANSVSRAMQAQPEDKKDISKKVWRAFGSYIAKQLKNGKGVVIPRFGNFTFSATNVNLEGTTNPQQRDKQHREPVFIVGKDFVSGVIMKPGMAYNAGTALRPYDVKGASGIIPKVKINYVEIGTLSGFSKDECRQNCEQIYRQMSDKVRGGQSCTLDIPQVGMFVSRSGIAAVQFTDDMFSETAGITAKASGNMGLFGNSNTAINNKIAVTAQQSLNSKLGLSGGIKVSHDAESWLRQNLDIDCHSIVQKDVPSIHDEDSVKLGSARALRQSYGNGFMNSGQKSTKNAITQQNLSELEKRTQTPVIKSTRAYSAYSRSTSYSRMTTLPYVDHTSLIMMVNDILRAQSAVINSLKGTRVTLRDTLSSSQILKIFRKVNCYLEIGPLKVLLKQMGFNHNGPSCTLTAFFTCAKSFIQRKTEEEDKVLQFFDNYTGENKNELGETIDHDKTQGRKDIQQVIQSIKDGFYNSKKSTFELFTEGKLGQTLDLQGFYNIVSKYCSSVSRSEVNQVFDMLTGQNKDIVPYEVFDKAFRCDEKSYPEFEVQIVKIVREWMYKNNMSSETAWEKISRLAGKFPSAQLSKQEFHNAVKQTSLDITAEQTEGLFNILSEKQKDSIGQSEWTSKIYEDCRNPLQMLREIVILNKMTPEDLIYQLQLRLWDDPLDNKKLGVIIRRLDPTISDLQIKHLGNSLKGSNGLVDIQVLIRNIAGKEHETVDFRNKILKSLYKDVYPSNEEKLISLCEEADATNDGRLKPQELASVLKKVCRQTDTEVIDRFVRQLDKDKNNKINYMSFIRTMSAVGNKDHNPFKSIVSRIKFFLNTNQQTTHSIMKKLGASSLGLPVEAFAKFLGQKIDKKKDFSTLMIFAQQIDIDKDGMVSEDDLNTCLDHLNSEAFFKQSGQALAQSSFNTNQKFYPNKCNITAERAAELAKIIRESIENKKVAPGYVFNQIDANQDGFINFVEFQNGIQKYTTLSLPLLEKIFAKMDTDNIGLVDFQHFMEFLKLTAQGQRDRGNVQDSFKWQEEIIEKLRNWVRSQSLTVEEAFKSFDMDFDGVINQNDLRQSLISILQVPAEKITDVGLDRLFKLIDFYKRGSIQMSDIQRLIHDQNPYGKTTVEKTRQDFSKTLGGSLSHTSTFNWKFSAIQNIGLVLSKKFNTLQESYKVASDNGQRITFDQFSKFVKSIQALNGFNLTLPLEQQLFSELDPHKKGFLAIQDWRNAFASFTWRGQTFIELQNLIQCEFKDCESGFQYFLSYNKTPSQNISKDAFSIGVASLTSKRFKQSDCDQIWQVITDNGQIQSLDKYQYRAHFEGLKYQGFSSVKKQGTSAKASMTLKTESSSSQQWQFNIVEKIRQIIKASTKSLREIFDEFDEDKNGIITQIEFRNAIRKLNLGLSSREIDQLMQQIDTNADGKINYSEFETKFKVNDFEKRMGDRIRDKIAKHKELMILHMTSPNDAYRFFDEQKKGMLSYQQFCKMIIKLNELGGQEPPAYPIIKDLFDTIDIRKDGILDIHEWQQTFGNVTEGDSKLTVKATPLSMWENSREYNRIGQVVAKNRKLLIESFRNVCSDSNNTEVNFEDAKKALDELFFQHFRGISDEKMQCILRPALVHGKSHEQSIYDYMKFLDLNKARYAGAQH